MKHYRFIAAAALTALLVFPVDARADEPDLPPMPPRPPIGASGPPPPIASMLKWGDANPICAEWTNACIVCKRDDAGVGQCSTPGFACQPKEPVCSRELQNKPPAGN